MRKIIGCFNELENEICGVYNILTRKDYTLGELNNILNAEQNIWYAIADIRCEGNLEKIGELLGLDPNKLLLHMNYFYYALEVWCKTISNCRLNKGSDLLSPAFMEWLADICKSALNEVRILADDIKRKLGETDENNDL